MPNDQIFTISRAHIKINGSAAAPEVEQKLVSLEVDDSLYLPSMATLEFNDPPDIGGDDGKTLVGAETFAIGAELEISFSAAGMPPDSLTTVFKGEVTSVEPDFNTEGEMFNRLVIRAYDKSHRLIRTKKTQTFLQVSDSDVIQKIAGDVGLAVNLTSTSTIHDYLLQNNQTNYEFIQERAARVGHIVRMEDGELVSKPLSGFTDAGPEITFGNQLYEFRPRQSAISQPDSYLVQSWDPAKKDKISASVTGGTLTGEVEVSRGKTLGSKFGASGDYGVVDPPASQTSEAEALAQANMDRDRNGDIQAEGIVAGDPQIGAGKILDVKGVSKFSGKYLVTRARHSYTQPLGYRIYFESTNGTGETTAALIGHDERSASAVYGVVVGIVTNIDDDTADFARVKVKFPWMISDIESWWARIATPMAGGGRGIQFMPEVNDEVLVAFEHGDVRRPYVIGALWGGVDAPPLLKGDFSKQGKVQKRVIKSTTGHILTFDDSDDQTQISIVDKTEKHKIVWDSKNDNITIDTGGDLIVKSAKKITVTGTGEISVKGDAAVTVKAATSLALEAGTDLSIKASTGIKMDGGAQVEIKGGVVKIN